MCSSQNAPVREPLRTCVGCREKSTQRALCRLKLAAGTVVVDDKGSLPGRGAWIHPTSSCYDNAQKRHAFARAFKTQKANAEALGHWLIERGHMASTSHEGG
ncbi:YlxR family protein [Arcanobacterium wilhelmae]|uniref:YlxR family protein n=1 Tax=Arcanobacterium wilhelmae TaxID=1803177 RepID=UPI0024151DC1|nr:YlxR family protein [Arcanobacterium wilhelmae]WFN89738.1 YlxR family protein [Arcanobacterium wilhelmae]